MNRRTFLRTVSGGLAGAGLGLAGLPGAFPAVMAGARRTPPSERIVMGIIGTGGMGGAHVNWFSGFDDVEVAAVCDVDGTHRDRALKTLSERRPGSSCKGYADFRKLLERKDIDAVSIASPDHWHALIALHAFRAGKDVYGEKPLSYTLPEGRAMVEARRKEGRVFQLGTQIHAGGNYHRVVDIVRSGVLGPIRTVRLWKTGGTPKIEPVPDAPPPDRLDWDMWLGPRPERPYNRHRCHFNFRYFWDYSGGHFADFWCHIADVVFWALDLGAPRTVTARGRLDTRGMGETHAVLDADFTFDGLDLFWTSRIPDVPGAEGRGIGACFEGEKGHLVTDYGSHRVFLDGREVPGAELSGIAPAVPRSPGHQRNFLDCVKSRALTESHIDYVHNMTAPMHLALIAFWMGRPLRWDGGTETFVDDAEANVLLDATYRKPWSLAF